MADIVEKVKQAARLCTECNGISCRECPYVEHNNNGVGIPMCGVVFATDVLSVIEQMEQEHRWIPVTERMPEEDEDVLVFNGAECCVMALVNRDKTDVWHWDGSYYMEWQNFDGSLTADVNDVTHWMPLPEPPERR